MKKAPIKLSAVARGWPEPGWNDGLTGAAAQAGAKSNDPNTWGTFEDCYILWQRKTPLIVGPAVALAEKLGLIVIDLDDPVEKAEQKVWKSAEAKDRAIADAKRHQNTALQMFNGHYIERSISGRGYHIFAGGRLPEMRYQFGFYGSVFGCCQFINLTGDVLR